MKPFKNRTDQHVLVADKMKKLQDMCLFCIANNLHKMPGVGQLLAPKYKELLLERMVTHDMLTTSYLSHITGNLFCASLKHITFCKCLQVDDCVLKQLGSCGAKFVTMKIHGCISVTGMFGARSAFQRVFCARECSCLTLFHGFRSELVLCRCDVFPLTSLDGGGGGGSVSLPLPNILDRPPPALKQNFSVRVGPTLVPTSKCWWVIPPPQDVTPCDTLVFK